jgi:hypothetical protein
MKTLFFILLLLYNLLIYSNEPEKLYTVKTLKLTFVDDSTMERLVGVKVDNSYSDLDGNILVTMDDTINISYVCYQPQKIKPETDMVVKLKQVSE